MKKVLFAVLICLVILLLFGPLVTDLSRDRQVDTELIGYCQNPSEGEGACTIHIQGRFRDYLFDAEADQFNGGIEGGIWVDECKLQIRDIPFHDKDEYTLLYDQQGIFFMDRECSTFVALLGANGSGALVVAPAADRDQALLLLEKLAREPENAWHTDFFSQCISRLNEGEM